MPLKGVLGLYTYIYPYISPALPAGCGRLWLDGCGDLIQLWILMNPLLYDGRESRKLRTWPKSCKNIWCCSRGQLQSDVTRGISKLPLGPWRDICHPRGQVASCAPRSSSVFVFSNSKAQRLTSIREEQPDGGCNAVAQWHHYLLGQHLLTFFTHAQTGPGQGRLFFHISGDLKIYFFPLLAVLWSEEQRSPARTAWMHFT